MRARPDILLTVRTDRDHEPDVPTPAHDDGDASIGAAVRTVSGVTLLSRVLGLVRDVVLARVFGDTAVGSAFVAALAVPNTFRRLFGEGALSAAFIPEYARYAHDDPKTASRFATLVLGALLVLTSLVVVAIQALLAWIVAANDLPPDGAFSLRLLIMTLPYAPLVCVAAVVGGMLQVHRRFGPPAAIPVVLNLCIIAGALSFALFPAASTREIAYRIAGAILLAGVIQVVWCVRALPRSARWTGGVAGAFAPARRTLRRFLPATVGLGSIQLNTLLDTLIAMWPIWIGPTMLGMLYPLDERSNSILFFSQRLYQFPLGVFGIAVATVVFPILSRRAEDATAFGDHLRRGLRLSLFIVLPASAGLALVAGDLIRVLYTGLGGGLSEEGVRRAVAVLAGYAAGVWAFSANQILARAFYARGDTITPMRVALAMVALNLALNLTLIWWLREAGLAWATTLTAVLHAGILFVLIRRRLGVWAIDAHARTALVRVASAVAVMAMLVLAARTLMGDPASWTATLARLGVMLVVGMGSYALLARGLRLPELAWLLAGLRKPR